MFYNQRGKPSILFMSLFFLCIFYSLIVLKRLIKILILLNKIDVLFVLFPFRHKPSCLYSDRSSSKNGMYIRIVKEKKEKRVR